jgi:hypothetical protein
MLMAEGEVLLRTAKLAEVPPGLCLCLGDGIKSWRRVAGPGPGADVVGVHFGQALALRVQAPQVLREHAMKHSVRRLNAPGICCCEISGCL